MDTLKNPYVIGAGVIIFLIIIIIILSFVISWKNDEIKEIKGENMTIKRRNRTVNSMLA